MRTDPIVIVGYARTPIGAFQGVLSPKTAAQLGSHAIEAAVKHSTVTSTAIDEVIMGCVLQAGQGQAPARQAVLGANLPETISCTTINKMCGSGMKAVMLAHDQIKAGSQHIMIAGGMESMSNAPYLIERARTGYSIGHGTLLDHIFVDGLEDAYDKGKLMGSFAEYTAEKFGFTRETQDTFAIASLDKANQAIISGCFKQEIATMTLNTKLEPLEILHDETPRIGKPERFSSLKPVFKKNGTITAANASSISDGAAALVLMKQSKANSMCIKPLAAIRGITTYAHAPNWFTTAPIEAIKQLLQITEWPIDNIDLFEINEAFAVVTLTAIRLLKLPPEKVNIHGGACALGHPIGASGARIICTLLAALERYSKNRGIASMCIGGGEATAIAIERLV